MGRASSLLIVACVLAVIAATAGASFREHNLRTNIAPAFTAAGVVAAAVIFFLKEASDRRRKTLEAYEKQLYDRDLRTAFSAISTALDTGTYELDSEDERVGSHRDQTSMLLNYLEVCCAGVERNLYERALFRDLMRPLAETLIEGFLVKLKNGILASKRFLGSGESFVNMRAVFSDVFIAAAQKPSTYKHHPAAAA